MPKFTCSLFLFITKATPVQCAPLFQQGQHLIKPPGSGGEGQGFAPGRKWSFPPKLQRNFQGIQAVGYKPPAPSYSALHVPGFSNCLDFCWEEAHMSCSTWFPLSLSLGGKWDSSGRACRIMEWCLGGPVPESTWTPPTSCPCAGGALHELKRSHQKNVGGRPKLAINAVVSQGGDLEQK